MGRDGGGGLGRGAERCELCGAPAAVHCAADAAFLCAACDARVHGANFLASRHRRRRLAPLGAGWACDVEEEEDDEEGYASAASSCVSTADSAAGARPDRGGRGRARRPARRRGAEAVLEAWAKRMGLAPGAARRRAAAAARAIRRASAGGPDAAAAAARVPPRVAMAAALWWEVVEAAGGAAGQGDALRRLEACAHVPARLVVAVASSMARARRMRAATDAVEGWDECSWAGPKPGSARS